MGVPSFLLASTINTTVAQRLLRLLCPDCKKKEAFDSSTLPRNFPYKNETEHHYIPVGCEHCYYTGYKGRKAIYEVIPIDYELANYIKKNDFDVSELLKKRNIKSLIENAFELFKKGETTIEEVLKNY
jgi:type IV pilus assembly protein PilB